MTSYPPNIPDKEQQKNIDDFEQYISEKIKKVLPNWNGRIVTYSAKRHFHLDELMTAMVEAVPKKRRWVLDECADVADYFDSIDPKFRGYIQSLM